MSTGPSTHSGNLVAVCGTSRMKETLAPGASHAEPAAEPGNRGSRPWDLDRYTDDFPPLVLPARDAFPNYADNSSLKKI